MLFESRFKSIVSYIFSKYHGENHIKYLSRENFDKDKNKEEKIAKLISDCYEIINICSNKKSKKYRQCIGHYVSRYGFVPLWVLIRAMTFGDVSIFYANMKLSEKEEIAQEFNLKPMEFADFWLEFDLNREQLNDINPIINKKILKEMGFLKNWRGIKSFRHLNN